MRAQKTLTDNSHMVLPLGDALPSDAEPTASAATSAAGPSLTPFPNATSVDGKSVYFLGSKAHFALSFQSDHSESGLFRCVSAKLPDEKEVRFKLQSRVDPEKCALCEQPHMQTTSKANKCATSVCKRQFCNECFPLAVYSKSSSVAPKCLACLCCLGCGTQWSTGSKFNPITCTSCGTWLCLECCSDNSLLQKGDCPICRGPHWCVEAMAEQAMWCFNNFGNLCKSATITFNQFVKNRCWDVSIFYLLIQKYLSHRIDYSWLNSVVAPYAWPSESSTSAHDASVDSTKNAQGVMYAVSLMPPDPAVPLHLKPLAASTMSDGNLPVFVFPDRVFDAQEEPDDNRAAKMVMEFTNRVCEDFFSAVANGVNKAVLIQRCIRLLQIPDTLRSVPNPDISAKATMLAIKSANIKSNMKSSPLLDSKSIIVEFYSRYLYYIIHLIFWVSDWGLKIPDALQSSELSQSLSFFLTQWMQLLETRIAIKQNMELYAELAFALTIVGRDDASYLQFAFRAGRNIFHLKMPQGGPIQISKPELLGGYFLYHNPDIRGIEVLYEARLIFISKSS